MTWYAVLRFGVILAALFSLGALAMLVAKTFGFGRLPHQAEPRQSAVKGIVYAFGQGMLPWEKESAGGHPVTFFMGVFYHLGIFASLFYVLTLALGVSLPPLLLTLFRPLFLAATLSGIGLLIKRFSFPFLRALSCPDDYGANLLVDLFLILALLSAASSGWHPVLLAFSIVLFIYLPLGKIRHCFFFFYTRILFGIFFGRRGVFPHPRREA